METETEVSAMKKSSSEIFKLLTSVCPFLGDLIDTTNLVIGDHMLQDNEFTEVRSEFHLRK
jgi:hypothetical protein